MTTEELTLICELPSYASFLDASYYLPYSPSIITKYVNNVEQELGIKLFIRSNKSRNLQLTEEGKLIIGSLRRLHDDWIYLKRQVNDLKNTDTRRLRIGAQPRFGNIHEQNIISEYLFKYPTAQVLIIKEQADELIRSLIAGTLDAAFIAFNDTLDLEEYFIEHGDKIISSRIVSENEMYAGISDKYFKGRSEVQLKELEQFTFTFPFPVENEMQSARAAQAWVEIAEEKGIDLKYNNLQGYDSTVFEMARQKKVAVTTTHIPTARYEGIKFVKISDWTGGAELYFLRSPLNRSQALRQLEICVNAYIKDLS